MTEVIFWPSHVLNNLPIALNEEEVPGLPPNFLWQKAEWKSGNKTNNS